MIELFVEVAKTFRFEAAHRLPNHGGECARPHGHSYRVEICVAGPVKASDGSPDEGMVIDFDELTADWNSRLKPQLDHRDLNELLEVPTAENIAAWIGSQLLRWTKVTVWETESCRATVRRG
jgi:6-pyruvoyltetrahydropterin/6-carboxytetrahydropterin synthase